VSALAATVTANVPASSGRSVESWVKKVAPTAVDNETSALNPI
jgi:hypothetical protein